jgi:DNA recombination protein RmuC
MTVELLIAWIVSPILLVACILLAIRWTRSDQQCKDERQRRQELDQANQELTQQRDSTREENSNLRTEIERNKERQKYQEERQRDLETMLTNAKQQFKETFDALAGNALDTSNARFLQLATEKLKPIQTLLDQYHASYQQIEASRKQEYGGLRQVAESLKDQTAGLVNALRKPEVRGKWGEVQLRRIAELAGMTDRCDFFEQEQVRTESGALRPDMIVKLPNQRTIVIDAKTVLSAFLDSLSASDPQARRALLDQQVAQIDQQIRQLSGKEYADQFDRAPDFVVLFLRVESAMYAAMEADPELIERAFSRKVILATPTTLIALLRAVEMGWREQRIAENAQRIREVGQELHQRICTAMEHLQKVGKSLGGAVKSYNDLVASIEHRVLPGSRKFEELGVGSNKALPAEDLGIEIMPRDVKTLPSPEETP